MSTTLTNSNLQQITEHIRDWRTGDVLIDTDSRVVRNVALSGTKSKNGYRYRAKALRKAIPLYENKPVFLDHATSASRPFERSTRDLVGSVVHVRFEDGRLRGDIQTLDTESGKMFIALAESNHPAVGMSHVVLAQRSPNKKTVEKIHEVVSVDAVVFPATTSTFRENLHEPTQSLPDSYEDLLEKLDQLIDSHSKALFDNKIEKVCRIGVFDNRVILAVHTEKQNDPQHFLLDWHLERGEVTLGDEPVFLTEEQFASRDFLPLKESHKTSKPISENERDVPFFESQREKLQSEIDELEEMRRAAEFRKRIDSMLASARLPEFSVTENFREQLESAKDDAKCQNLIDDRLHLLRLATSSSPSSTERFRNDEPLFNDARIVSMIRGKKLSL